MSRKRKYSDEFRLMLVDEYLSGKNGGFKTITKKECH
jgi:transposase-like protein